jgi:hypothetical protein
VQELIDGKKSEVAAKRIEIRDWEYGLSDDDWQEYLTEVYPGPVMVCGAPMGQRLWLWRVSSPWWGSVLLRSVKIIQALSPKEAL